MIAFALLGIVLFSSALFTVGARTPVYSVVGLLVNFVALALMYLTLGAEFLAVIQIVVYSGAILILFLFVIALLSSGVGPLPEGPNRLPFALVPAIVVVLASFALMVVAIARAPETVPAHPTSALGPAGAPQVFGSVADFGTALFTTHLLPFEITAFVLMVAVIGVVLLAGDAALAPTHGRHRVRRPGRRESIVKPEPAGKS